MDIIGVIEGSDKSSSHSFAWDYLRHYESLFMPWRREKINLIEVGVQYGPSLHIWEWFFTQAQIVGVDIDPACAAYARDRVAIEIGNQADPVFLDRLCASYPPTIFIDDGSHRAEHIVVTFERVFPRLLPGGLYIIEDMSFHFGPAAVNWQTAKQVDAPGYFLNLSKECMARQPGNRFVRQIDQIGFIGGAIIIHKRTEGRDLGHALNTADAYLAARKRDADALDRMAYYVLRHNGPLARAEQWVDEATELGGDTMPRLMLRGEMNLALGRMVEAVEAFLAAAAYPVEGTAQQHYRLSRFLAKYEQLEAALGQARVAHRLAPRNPGYKNHMDGLAEQLAAG